MAKQRRLSRRLIVVLALLTAVAALSTDLYLPAFPLVSDDLEASASAVQLTLTGFMVGMAAGQLFWGPVSDRFGRYRPLLLASILLVAASAVSALSTSIGMLVLARVLQGLAGSAGVVIARAIGRDLATGHALARLFSVLAVIMGIAPVVAPVIGGILVGPVGWQGVLWVLTAFTVIILLAVIAVVPETLPIPDRAPAGLRQVGRSLVTVLSDRSFLGYTLVQGFGFGTVFAFISASSFVLQEQYELSETAYSVVFAINAVGMILGGILNGRLVGRLGEQRLLRIGVTTLVAAATLLAALAVAGGRPPLVALQALVFLASLCVGPIMANSATLALGRHGGATAGMAAAILGAVQSGLAGTISPLVSLNGPATALSMAVVMAVSALCAGATYVALCRPAKAAGGGPTSTDAARGAAPEVSPPG